jgi:serine/threonine-protein kinase HipA
MGRVEYAYHKMATDSGITMAECRLLEEGGRAHFMTRRFDRPGRGEKLHMQTICAMANMNFRLKRTHSYERVFFTLNRLKLPYTAIEQQFRRMVFNVVAKNCDDHTKNISFLMNKEGQWSLAPAYDVSYAYDPTGEWNSCHLLSVNGKFENFTLSDLEKVGQEQSLKDGKHIIAQICDVVSHWPEYAKAAGVDKSLYKSIAKVHEIVAV